MQPTISVLAVSWKRHLLARNRSPQTIKTYLHAVESLAGALTGRGCLKGCGAILAIGGIIVVALFAIGAYLDNTDPGWRERQDAERAVEKAAENRAWCAEDDSTALDGDEYFERCTSTCSQVQGVWEMTGSLAYSSGMLSDWEVNTVWRAAEKRAEELGCSTRQWQVAWGLGG